MPTQTEKSRQSARLFLSSVTTDNDATDPVPIHKCPNPPDLIHGGNQGRGELCRRRRRYQPCTNTLVPKPARLDTWRKPGGRRAVSTLRDATNLVPIHKCPNPPGDEPTQKPGKGRTDCGAVHRMVLFSLWLGLFETANPFPFVPICCIIKQKRLIVIGGSS